MSELKIGDRVRSLRPGDEALRGTVTAGVRDQPNALYVEWDIKRMCVERKSELATDPNTPAMGVTADEAEMLVNNLLYLYRCIGYGDTRRGLFSAFEEARSEIIDLLTTQPDAAPGTSDDAGEGQG